MLASLFRTLLIVTALAALVLVPVVAGAQQIPTPGVTPEEVRGWTWYLFAVPVALATIGVVALVIVL
ncbi:MAG: hypothetical protein ACRDKA_14730, partial [Actinomycetota bacterium]